MRRAEKTDEVNRGTQTTGRSEKQQRKNKREREVKIEAHEKEWHSPRQMGVDRVTRADREAHT